MSIDAFWGTFGTLLIIFVMGVIYVRTQMTKHDGQIENLSTKLDLVKQQSDKANAIQDQATRDIEVRLMLEIERLRTDSQMRQSELKEDIHKIDSKIDRLFELLTKRL